MPFQPINFLNMPQQQDGLAQLPKRFAEGFNIGQMPAKAQQAADESRIHQALMQAQAGQAGATTNKMNQDIKKSQMLQNIMQQMMGGQQGGQPNQQPNQQTGSFPQDLAQAMFRKSMGLPVQTPNEKSEGEMNLFNQKQEVTKQNKMVEPTGATKTYHQGVVAKAPDLLNVLDDLIKGPVFGKTHTAKIQEAVEKLSSVEGFPKGAESLDRAETILKRGVFETPSAYAERLTKLSKDIAKKSSVSFENQQQKIPDSFYKHLAEKTTTHKGKTYYFVKGKWHTDSGSGQ